MAKSIFISFDYDHDRRYRYLLKALKENPRSDIEFIDVTPEEIKSESVPRIKGVLTNRIRQSTHTLIIIGQYANSEHPDVDEIGEPNWQWWEIKKSISESNGLIAVKIDRTYNSPDPLLNEGAVWAMSFNVESIVNAIDKA